jgi:hypothetical protein
VQQAKGAVAPADHTVSHSWLFMRAVSLAIRTNCLELSFTKS